MANQYEKKDLRWWIGDDTMRPTRVWDAYHKVKEDDGPRRAQYLKFMRLYGGADYLGFGINNYDQVGKTDRITLNVVKATTDTIVARIAKNRPRPVFLTSGGNFSLQRRARLLGKYTDAAFYNAKVWDEAPRAFLDCCVLGSGALKTYREGTKQYVERTFPGEIFVDRAEGLYGKPRQLFQQKLINREVLAARFPEHKQLIELADVAAPDDLNPSYDSMSDQLEVVECWHLPSSDEAGDGMHIIAIKDVVLFQEKWKYNDFPFVFIHWSDRLRGFWGQGIAEELTGIQIEINKLLIKIQRAFHLLAVPWIMVEQTSKIKKAHIVNEIGAIIPYMGTPPIVKPNQTIHPEVFAHLDRLYQRAFETVGVSQLSASSIKPAGLESGAALREYNDIESERFAVTSRRYEQMFLDVAKHQVTLGREIAEEFPDYSVVSQRDKYTIEEVKWKDVDLDADSYILKVYPASALPQTPAGRLAMVEQLIAANLISVDVGKRMLDFPDLEIEQQLDRAASDNIDRIIEKILDDGIYESPEPFNDHLLALKKCQAAYNRALQFDDMPDDHLRLLRQYMLQTHQMMKRAMLEAQQPLSTAAPGAPPATLPSGAQPTAIGPGDGTATM